MSTPNPFRHQLASTSPIALSGLVGALGTSARPSRRPRAELAELLADLFGVHGVVLCGSGTEALVLALRAAEVLTGTASKVAWPAFSCFDLASAAVRHGRPVCFYDVDPATLGPEPTSVGAALEGGADVLVTASLFGIPIDWDRIDPVVAGTDTVVIEDAAQGHGARWNGARLGGWGRLGVLSFGRGKGWTGGAGGALLIRREEDAARLSTLGPEPDGLRAELGALVRASAHWALGRPGLYGIPRRIPGLNLGETTYHEVGDPSGIPLVAADLVLRSHAAAEREAEHRRGVAQRYASELAGAATVRLVDTPTRGQAGYLRYPILLADGLSSFSSRGRAIRLGAAASYPTPLPVLPVLASLYTGPGVDAWPGAARLVRRLVTLPTHGRTTETERQLLVRMLKS